MNITLDINVERKHPNFLHLQSPILSVHKIDASTASETFPIDSRVGIYVIYRGESLDAAMMHFRADVNCIWREHDVSLPSVGGYALRMLQCSKYGLQDLDTWHED